LRRSSLFFQGAPKPLGRFSDTRGGCGPRNCDGCQLVGWAVLIVLVLPLFCFDAAKPRDKSTRRSDCFQPWEQLPCKPPARRGVVKVTTGQSVVRRRAMCGMCLCRSTRLDTTKAGRRVNKVPASRSPSAALHSAKNAMTTAPPPATGPAAAVQGALTCSCSPHPYQGHTSH
jgi:hypothetical protein